MFGRLFKRKSFDPTGEFSRLLALGHATAAEIAVTPSVAMRCTPAFAATRVRCETLGSLPLHLYQRRDDGGKDRATDHPLYALLHDRPNAWTSSAEFVMALELDTLTHGAGYALANRVGGKIVEFIRIKPGSCKAEIDDATLEPKYVVSLANGGRKTYGWQDILHVPSLDGMSVVQNCREAVGLFIAMERHASHIFSRGGRPSGLLKTKHHLSMDSLDRLKKSWNEKFSGGAAGGTAVLEDGIEWEALTFNSVDLQFQELRAFQVVEIARGWGVPPMLIMDFGRATWSNSESMAQAFLTFTLLPRMRLWAGAISRLLSPQEQKIYYPEFLVDELVKADIAQRFEAYAKAISSRILNPNECRAKENLAPYDGGDKYENPNTMTAAASEPVKPADKPGLRVVA